jgi:predicted DNA-binding protein
VRPKKTVPFSLRLSPELTARLEECATQLRLKKHSLAQDAIEAAVEAIERNDYRLVVPVQFEVTHVPAVRYPSRQGDQFMTSEERVEARAQEIERMERERIIRARGKTPSSAKPAGPGSAAPTDEPIAAPPSPLTPREGTVSYRPKRKSSRKS